MNEEDTQMAIQLDEVIAPNVQSDTPPVKIPPPSEVSVNLSDIEEHDPVPFIR